jgi:transcriptional regulator of acetoin/glycerol metabolism
VQCADLNLPAARTPAAPHGVPGREEEPLSRESIEASLKAAGGNISRAAHGLGLSRQALYRRMERFGLRSTNGGACSRDPEP